MVQAQPMHTDIPNKGELLSIALHAHGHPMGTLFDPLGTAFERSDELRYAASGAFAYDSGGLHCGPGRKGVSGPYPTYPEVGRTFFMLVSPALTDAAVRAHMTNNCIRAAPETISLAGTGLFADLYQSISAVGAAALLDPAMLAGCSLSTELTGFGTGTGTGAGAGAQLPSDDAIGVDHSLPWLTQPLLKLSSYAQSRRTHNILTISHGVLVTTVAFGTSDDDDQHLGVLATAASADSTQPSSSYGYVRDKGWTVKEGHPPFAPGRKPQHAASEPGGCTWRLSGCSVTLRLDIGARTVSFWSTAGMKATLTGLPAGVPLTAAFSSYRNSAMITALRHLPSAAAQGGQSDNHDQTPTRACA